MTMQIQIAHARPKSHLPADAGLLMFWVHREGAEEQPHRKPVVTVLSWSMSADLPFLSWGSSCGAGM